MTSPLRMLDAALQREVRLGHLEAVAGTLHRHHPRGALRRLGIAVEVDLQPVQFAFRRRVDLHEAPRRQSQQWPRARIAAQERQGGVVAHVKPREERRQRIAALDARFAHEGILALQQLLDLVDDGRRGDRFDDRLRLQLVEVERGGGGRESGDRGGQRQQRQDRAEFNAGAARSIDAMPATREHAEA